MCSPPDCSTCCCSCMCCMCACSESCDPPLDRNAEDDACRRIVASLRLMLTTVAAAAAVPPAATLTLLALPCSAFMRNEDWDARDTEEEEEEL